MAIKYACDSCGAEGTEFKMRGLLNIMHYCPDCLGEVDLYLKARDDLHTSMAETFSHGVETMKKEWHKHHQGKLPDES